jgi:ABC-type enterochelin transport system substrate-binding protein
MNNLKDFESDREAVGGLKEVDYEDLEEGTF